PLDIQSKAVAIDMKEFSPDISFTHFITQKVKENDTRSIIVIKHLNHISKYYPSKEVDVARVLNFSREFLSDLQKIIIFILPEHFVNILIKYAKDFYDFVVTTYAFNTYGDIRIESDEELKPNTAYLDNRREFKQYLLTHCKTQKERLKIIGDIASIEFLKGNLQGAIRQYSEKLIIIEALGDQRERAVTLGDIARIKVSQGEVDEALRHYQEALNIFEELGDQRSRAVCLRNIARIRLGRGEIDKALLLHQDGLNVFNELGYQREKAITLGDIARIKNEAKWMKRSDCIRRL
ncbi:MAG: hypothetical protein OMM_14528, partial [Candidatus Magnetoglobus multicellularis str. Araruama]